MAKRGTGRDAVRTLGQRADRPKGGTSEFDEEEAPREGLTGWFQDVVVVCPDGRCKEAR